jgi:hypothetical protein
LVERFPGLSNEYFLVPAAFKKFLVQIRDSLNQQDKGFTTVTFNSLWVQILWYEAAGNLKI